MGGGGNSDTAPEMASQLWPYRCLQQNARPPQTNTASRAAHLAIPQGTYLGRCGNSHPCEWWRSMATTFFPGTTARYIRCARLDSSKHEEGPSSIALFRRPVNTLSSTNTSSLRRSPNRVSQRYATYSPSRSASPVPPPHSPTISTFPASRRSSQAVQTGRWSPGRRHFPRRCQALLADGKGVPLLRLHGAS